MHITDVQKFLKCPRLYQLSLKDEYKPFPYFNINIKTADSLIKKLGIYNYYEGVPNENNEDTFDAFKRFEWLVNARFVYRGLRIKIPFINKVENGFDIYFSLLNLNPTNNDSNNISWCISVLKRLNISINNVYIIHLNPAYKREGELDDQQLWTITDSFYTPTGKQGQNIKEYVEENLFNVDASLDALLHFDSDDISYNRSSKCTSKNKCKYYDICFPEEKNLPTDSILKLVGSQHKYEMYEDGIKYLSQVDLLKIEGTKQQYAQVMASKLGGLYYDKIALNNWLTSNSKFPISFIDFEWDIYAIPPYDGMSPLEVLPFQYSIHVYQEDGQVSHYEYIGDGDCRKEFVENLLKDLPKSGTIFAYNAFSAEVLRLKTFAQEFPSYSEQINQVTNRFVDMALPFVKGFVYDVRMNGLYSLKAIQAVVDPEHSYSDLDIENGLEAVKIYRLLQQSEEQEVREKYYKELYEYCGLDSLAMLEIYNWLKEINTSSLV